MGLTGQENIRYTASLVTIITKSIVYIQRIFLRSFVYTKYYLHWDLCQKYSEVD